jgi:hypothetical protein
LPVRSVFIRYIKALRAGARPLPMSAWRAGAAKVAPIGGRRIPGVAAAAAKFWLPPPSFAAVIMPGRPATSAICNYG